MNIKRCGWKKKVIACLFHPEQISLPGEQWRPVVGWENFYRVSNLGRVYALHQSGRLITGMLVRGGYRVIKLREGARHGNSMVHRMVLEAFVGACPESCEACHNDGDSSNNALSNLRWDTKLSNHADKNLHGTGNKGRKYPSLTEDAVTLIRSSPSVTDKEWAQRFGVTEASIMNARSGKTWRRVNTPPLHKPRAVRRRITPLSSIG